MAYAGPARPGATGLTALEPPDLVCRSHPRIRYRVCEQTVREVEMKRVGAMVIAAGVVLSVNLLRPPVAVGQATSEANGGAQALVGEPIAGSGLMNRDR